MAVTQRRKVDVDDIQPVVEILAEFFSSTIFRRSAFVAASMRTSTLTTSFDPSGVNSFS